MNEPELYPQLSAVLDRATDGIEPPEAPQHAAVTALARARVVRNRRRGLAAGAVAAVAVLVAWMAVGLNGADRADTPITPSSTIPDSAIQGTWDPRTATELPQRSSVLPTSLQPPADAGGLPLTGAALLALVDQDGSLTLLGADDTWARTELPSGAAFGAALSADGTQLAAFALGKDAIWVTDVRDGTWRQLDLTSDMKGLWLNTETTIAWQDDTHIVLRSFGAGLQFVDVSGDSAPSLPIYRSYKYTGYAPTPDGAGLLFASGNDSGTERPVLQEVAGSKATRTIDVAALGRIYAPVAAGDRVAGVAVGAQRSGEPSPMTGLVALAGADHTVSAFLPTAQGSLNAGEFSADRVSPLGWLDANTVLLRTNWGEMGTPWAFVAWDVDSGKLSLVSTGSGDAQPASVAADLVRD